MVPGWQVEDKPYDVLVVASTQRGRAAYVYTAPSARGTGTATPLSRGRPCSTDRRGRQVTGVGTCPLTDGDLFRHEQVRLRGECSVDDTSCRPPHHTRICVDLGRSHPVGRVVVRSPFDPVDRVVEVSGDGRSFRDWRPGDAGRWVCVRSSRYGFSGAVLSEISVW